MHSSASCGDVIPQTPPPLDLPFHSDFFADKVAANLFQALCQSIYVPFLLGRDIALTPTNVRFRYIDGLTGLLDLLVIGMGVLKHWKCKAACRGTE